MSHLIVTGGNGYIGEALVRAALERGWHVTSLERRPKSSEAIRLRRLPWRLGEPLPPEARQGVPPPDMIVHAAHMWDTGGGTADPNVVGTEALFHSSQAAGIGRFVFVSSVSARQDALNAYGRLKWRLEQLVSAHDGISARVGLVYGGPRRAQYGVLVRLAGMRALPMIDPLRDVQPIHLSEVCQGLLSLAAAPTLSRSVYVLAPPSAMTFADFLRTLARVVHQRSLLIVPIPAAIALFMADVSRRIPLLPKVNRERILGLRGMRFVPSREHLSEIGLVVNEMTANLQREPLIGLRHLVREGAALLAYVLGSRPPAPLLRRYVRGARASREGEVLALPSLARRWPCVLRCLEPLPRRATILSRRLGLATRVAEASAAGSDRFFAYGGTRLGSLAAAGGQLVWELLALPFRLMRR